MDVLTVKSVIKFLILINFGSKIMSLISNNGNFLDNIILMQMFVKDLFE